MEQVTKLKGNWNLVPVLQIVQMIPESYCPCLYLSIGQVWWLNKLWFKKYIQKCTLYYVLILIRQHRFGKSWHGMVKKRKTWISWEWNINFQRNKKILNLSLIWNILRSYRFVAEVTFKNRILPNIKVTNNKSRKIVVNLVRWYVRNVAAVFRRS